MIIESLEKARREDTKRGDEHLAHVADLYGCDRATWYRRHGYPSEPHDEAKLRKFSVGNDIEQGIITRLLYVGHSIARGETITLEVMPDGELRGDASTAAPNSPDVVVGHPDARVDRDVLLELKTTDARKVAEDVSPHYALQAAAYALALGLPKAIVHVTHVANFTKDEAEYAIEPEDYRERVTERVAQVLARTGSHAPMPEPQPEPESAAWACNYCAWRDQCEMDGGPAPTARKPRK